ncbi:hypothetical protein BDN70DRAFT_897008 [Pholiota conissans]|uniref:Uncharacterized protein n=1 Tax=Pholiota conissans TaxID=109636 RepID=A0A9P5YYE9_9AGAR|nr:hypothetical protein BDN70DRAFT_897008 [Pholiota conissans]
MSELCSARLRDVRGRHLGDKQRTHTQRMSCQSLALMKFELSSGDHTTNAYTVNEAPKLSAGVGEHHRIKLESRVLVSSSPRQRAAEEVGIYPAYTPSPHQPSSSGLRKVDFGHGFWGMEGGECRLVWWMIEVGVGIRMLEGDGKGDDDDDDGMGKNGDVGMRWGWSGHLTVGSGCDAIGVVFWLLDD